MELNLIKSLEVVETEARHKKSSAKICFVLTGTFLNKNQILTLILTLIKLLVILVMGSDFLV